jgi:pimeloyl-ACP methyl ester carboxylesterase
LRAVRTPEGIDSLVAVEIDGTTQWISIRGLNRANPILLMIHGGPGTPMMATSWAFQTPWEDFFTVVQWEQRGAGKNFLATDTTKVKGPFTLDQIVADAESVVTRVTRALGKTKVIVLGFSWGSVVGTRLAAKRPDLLHAYVGVGQAADAGERYLLDRTIELAKRANNADALKELEAIKPYPSPNGSTPERSVRLVRKWARTYNGAWFGRQDFDVFYEIQRWAPEYSDQDVAVLRQAERWAGGQLFASMMAADSKPLVEFRVPMIFLHGRYDLFTPYVAAREFYRSIRAPVKKFIPFERSAHFVMFEEPGRFLLTLINEVRPLTNEAADFAPLPDAVSDR